MGGEEWNPKILVDLLVTNVPGYVSRNAKTLGLQHLYLINVCVGSRPPDRACVVHHLADELLEEQYAISDGQITPVQEGAKQTQTLSCLLPYLVGVSRPCKPFVKGTCQLTLRRLSRDSPESIFMAMLVCLPVYSLEVGAV
jgi:hypothetical protein